MRDFQIELSRFSDEALEHTSERLVETKLSYKTIGTPLRSIDRRPGFALGMGFVPVRE